MKTLNRTNINPTLVLNILKASHVALNRGTVEHVVNRKGHAIVAIRPVKVSNKVMLKVVGSNGENLASTLCNGLAKNESLRFKWWVRDFFMHNVAYDYELKQNKATFNSKGEFL